MVAGLEGFYSVVVRISVSMKDRSFTEMNVEIAERNAKKGARRTARNRGGKVVPAIVECKWHCPSHS
jgi:hypothetical protein